MVSLIPKDPTMVVADEGPKWEDNYFNDLEGVVAVFDFDYDKIINFDWEFRKMLWCVCPCSLLPESICCGPCFAHSNIVWATRSQHVAVHRDGIKYVTEKRKSMCGFECQDVGKHSKTVPFDKLTDCDVQEPAGAALCCCVPNVLSSVTVDTASSGQSTEGGIRHELLLRGLKDPHGFKKCVWDCKRGHMNFSGADGISGVVNSLTMSDRGAAGSGDGSSVPLLLAEIRDELRAQTKILRERP